MECPHCGGDLAEPDKYCRKCGKFVALGELATTPLLTQSLPNNSTVKAESNNPQHKEQSKAGPEAGSQDEGAGPNVDLGALIVTTIKCALGLGIPASVIHLSAPLFAGYFGTEEKIKAAKQIETAKRIILGQDIFTQDKTHDPTVYILQAILAGLFLVLLFTPMGFSRKGRIRWGRVARDTFQQFLKGWSAVWVSWLLLYSYFGIMLLGADSAPDVRNVYLQVTVDFLNVANSAAFFYVFLVLDMPSISSKAPSDRNRDIRVSLIAVVLICLVVFLLSAYSRFNQNQIGVYTSGLLVAISMAYVFGRLDSHYMNVRRLMLAPLYLYAVIQVSGPDLVDFSGVTKELQQKFFFATVLVLKVYLFFIVTYWLLNGSFEKYFNTASERRSKKKA